MSENTLRKIFHDERNARARANVSGQPPIAEFAKEMAYTHMLEDYRLRAIWASKIMTSEDRELLTLLGECLTEYLELTEQNAEKEHFELDGQNYYVRIEKRNPDGTEID